MSSRCQLPPPPGTGQDAPVLLGQDASCSSGGAKAAQGAACGGGAGRPEEGASRGGTAERPEESVRGGGAHDDEADAATSACGRCTGWYARAVVGCPVSIWLCCVILVLLLSAVSVSTMSISDDDLAWAVFDADSTRTWTAWQDAKAKADPESEGRRLDGPPADKPDGGLVDSEFGSADWWTLTLLYKSDQSGSGNIFTPERLQEMCRLEALVVSQPSTWVVSDSAARLFYEGRAEAESCSLLDQGTVSTKLGEMFADVSANGPSSQYARFVHLSFASSGESAYSRTSMSITGGPDRDESDHRREITEGAILADLGLSYSFLRSALQVEEDRFQPSGPLRVRLAYHSEEIDWMINDDFTLALGAVVVVFLLIYLYLRSGFLASTSIFQIMTSLPVAYLFYTHVWGVSFFDFLHVLTVYLVLGIGADDVFVLVDTFRHVSEEHPVGRGFRHTDKQLARILQTTLERSGQAIFNTTFTTTVAFMSQSVSGIMPMRTLGYFASTCIAMNFVFTMLWTPSALIMHHKRLEGKRCCCPGLAIRPEDLRGARDGGGVQLEARRKGGLSGCTETFLQRVYIPIMRKQVAGVRIVALASVVIVLAVAIQGVYFTSQLTPPTKAEVWIPDNHMHLEISEFWSSTFYEADFEKYSIITFTWGIAGLDDSDFVEFEPSKNAPKAIFDSGFDISTSAAHVEILDVCAEMQRLKCQLEGCQGYGDTLMISTQDKAYSCFLEDMQDYLGGGALPTGDAFLEKLQEFVDAAPSDQYSSDVCPASYNYDVGYIDGELKYVSVKLRTRLALDEPYSTGKDVRDMIQDFVDGRQGGAPSGLKSMSFTNDDGVFAGYDLSEELLKGLLSGIAISFPLAFVVLLVSTRDIVMSSFAVSCVGGIVVSVLGFCKSAMGWDLGIGEAIAGVIIIGYSVDYVVHLAVIYREAADHGHQTRDAKTTFAVENMGSTIFAGALTTAGSGTIMFFCFLVFFHKMAILICATIMYSFIFSMGLFVPLLWLAGSERRSWTCSRASAEP